MRALKKLLMVTIMVMIAAAPTWAGKAMKLDLNAIYGSTSFHTAGAMDFAALVEKYSNGSVVITVHPGGSLGFKGPELLKAVKDAQLPMSDILMGVVAGSEHVFGLSSLPRLAGSFEEAKKLYGDSKPLYERAAAKWNQKFLYAAPWPPSGLVTSRAVASSQDIKGLKTRTYDKNGANFLRELGGGDKPLLLLVLDSIQDPHNLGACLRTAEAAGVDAVIVPRHGAAGLGPAVSKVAAGAAESLPQSEATGAMVTIAIGAAPAVSKHS